jgi:hypothetical protein
MQGITKIETECAMKNHRKTLHELRMHRMSLSISGEMTVFRSSNYVHIDIVSVKLLFTDNYCLKVAVIERTSKTGVVIIFRSSEKPVGLHRSDPWLPWSIIMYDLT